MASLEIVTTSTLEGLPVPLLDIVLRSLEPADLAALGTQSTYLRKMVDQDFLWEGFCKEHWPSGDVSLYDGSWCRMYRQRAALPHGFVRAVDQINAITKSSMAEPKLEASHAITFTRLRVETLMRAVMMLGLEVDGSTSLKKTVEFSNVKANMAWWLTERPDLIIGFIRRVGEAASSSGFSPIGHRRGSSNDAGWVRTSVSELKFLGFLSAAHPSVADRIQRECHNLNRVCSSSLGLGYGWAFVRRIHLHSKKTRKMRFIEASALILIACAGLTSGAAAFSNEDYKNVLDLSLSFYQAQRSGQLPDESKGIPWRKSAHTDDCVAGGFYDAGDYLKLNFPMANAMSFLAWGMVEFPDAYRSAGQFQRGVETLKWGADYLAACHIDKEKLIGQIGDPDKDHSFWGRPEQQPSGPANRPCYTWDSSKSASDLASATASALAGTAIVVKPQDSEYAANLIKHARELFDYAAKYEGKYSSSYAATYVYTSATYLDDLAHAAMWLYKATGEARYLEAAKAYRSRGDFSKESYVNWDAVSPVSAIMMMCEGVATDEAKSHITQFLADWQQDQGGMKKTPGGLVIAPLGGWGNLRHATSAALASLVYAKCETDSTKKQAAINWAQSQVDYALGSNGRSFVVGYGTNPPQKAHHRGASCPDSPAICDYSALDNPGPNPQVLYGALVGGPPGPGDDYVDDRRNYQTNEVAIDYNAGFTGALAGLISLKNGGGSPSAPPPPAATPAPAPAPRQPGSGCTDEPPNKEFSCAEQVGWGACNQSWMPGYCNKSCGKCV